MKYFEPVYVNRGISRILKIESPDDARQVMNIYMSDKVKLDAPLVDGLYPCYLIDNNKFTTGSPLPLHNKEYVIKYIDSCRGFAHTYKERKDLKNLKESVQER